MRGRGGRVAAAEVRQNLKHPVVASSSPSSSGRHDTYVNDDVDVPAIPGQDSDSDSNGVPAALEATPTLTPADEASVLPGWLDEVERASYTVGAGAEEEAEALVPRTCRSSSLPAGRPSSENTHCAPGSRLQGGGTDNVDLSFLESKNVSLQVSTKIVGRALGAAEADEDVTGRMDAARRIQVWPSLLLLLLFASAGSACSPSGVNPTFQRNSSPRFTVWNIAIIAQRKFLRCRDVVLLRTPTPREYRPQHRDGLGYSNEKSRPDRTLLLCACLSRSPTLIATSAPEEHPTVPHVFMKA